MLTLAAAMAVAGDLVLEATFAGSGALLAEPPALESPSQSLNWTGVPGE